MNTYIGAWQRRPLLRTFVLLLRSVLLVLSSSRPCHAWTETRITSAHARVDARDTQRATVELTLGVHVTAGWLSRFELLDLGPELQPDSAREVSFVDAHGAEYTPTVRTTDRDSLLLEFTDRRHAPKAGDYTLVVAWTSRVSDGTWTLPRWPNRIPNAHIEVLAPAGSRPLAGPGPLGDGVRVQELPAERATLLQYTRAELPRTEGFAVRWAVPTGHSETRTDTLAMRGVRDGLGAGLELLCLLSNALTAANVSGCD